MDNDNAIPPLRPRRDSRSIPYSSSSQTEGRQSGPLAGSSSPRRQSFAYPENPNDPREIQLPTYSYVKSSPRPPASILSRKNTGPTQGYSAEKRSSVASSDDPRDLKRQDLTENIMEWFSTSRSGTHEVPQQSNMSRRTTCSDDGDSSGSDFHRPSNWRRNSMYSNMSLDSEMMDLEDSTGENYNRREKEDDVEKNALRRMDYKTRRKHIQRIRIQLNVSSLRKRYEFLLKLARGLMTFGAPSHRIESQLTAAARILEVEAEFIHLPAMVICSFGEQELGSSETHFVKCGGRLSLGALHKVHLIYRSVVHDEVSAEAATEQLEALLNSPPPYTVVFRCFLAFCLSALICPLAFGGSFVDMWIAGLAAFILCWLQLRVAEKSALYANVFEITISILVSFVARGLSSIRSQIFCYTAISSSGIIGILPGYLILSSSLELASKNIVCGSVKMVYALIYTLFLGFGLQIGNDFYLLLDPYSRRQLDDLSASLSNTISLTGTWHADNGTVNGTSIPLNGTWTFSHDVQPIERNIIDGCYRPKMFPWFLQPFPIWTAFVIVPLFSFLSSLSNLQPLKSRQLPVMVVISCCSYASNKIANHYIFNRSDIVSAIGAFTVGLLGNIYSRKMGGTAFTSMVTGVLFLVPSGLSQAGGITANGSGIDIGGAMIAVTIGITVGLFMSQALVYTFGSRKNAAVFSF